MVGSQVVRQPSGQLTVKPRNRKMGNLKKKKAQFINECFFHMHTHGGELKRRKNARRMVSAHGMVSARGIIYVRVGPPSHTC